MKTVYVYLFRSSYTDEHVMFMDGMLNCMAGCELDLLSEQERTDLNAWEIKLEASPWAINFLEHMSNCDMLHMTYEPIICD